MKKLYDHVNLDIARIKYVDSKYYKISSNIKLEDISHNEEVLRNKIEKLENTVKATSKQAAETEEKINNTQKEYIAILGIFSSIILAFIGGIVFSSSVLENIHKSSIYRILFISLIIGFILINVIYILFYFIFLIVKKEHKPYKSCWIIIFINAIIIVAAIFTFCSWKYGWIEKRDQEVKNMIEPTTVSSTEELLTETNKK